VFCFAELTAEVNLQQKSKIQYGSQVTEGWETVRACGQTCRVLHQQIWSCVLTMWVSPFPLFPPLDLILELADIELKHGLG